MIFRKPKTRTRPQRQAGLGTIRRYGRDSRGSVAIEFGILAVPFLALVFAVFESCMSFAAQQLMSNATDEIARDVRTGELRAAALNDASLKDLVCARLKLIVDDSCPELEVDMQQYARFSNVPTRVPFTASGDINTAGFRVTPGGASTINQLRVFYRWPVMTDFMRASMSNLPNGKTLLFSSATWRNEPFD